jgi:hypothetical protein
MELAWVKQANRRRPAVGAARLCVCLFVCLFVFAFCVRPGRSHAAGSAGAVQVVPFAFVCLFVGWFAVRRPFLFCRLPACRMPPLA